MTRRLSITIFLAVLGSLVLFAAAAATVWWWNVDSYRDRFEQRLAGELAAEILPAGSDGVEALQRSLERWHHRTRADLTVLDGGRVIAWAGRRLVGEGGAGGPAGHGGPGGRRAQAAFDLDLPDGRTLLVRPVRRRPGPPPIGAPLALALLVGAVALVAWPVSRRITRRLETLQRGVDQQGAGDLAARVAVQGKDEVAALARSFNRSAARIEDLVQRQDALLASQKRLLANASHELRSPLARSRMALELLRSRPDERESLVAELQRNIAELDQLVDEILLASRLETATPVFAELDLAGLAAEEAARVGAELDVTGGDAPLIAGDARLLRRLLRNLLENASRYHNRRGDGGDHRGNHGVDADGGNGQGGNDHGGGDHGGGDHGDGSEPVRIVLARGGGRVRVTVCDRGPGVPVDAREKIFEPFYRVEGHSERSGGVGLGLALVRQIATAHGGTVRCEPRDGGGSRFVVELPDRPPEPAPVFGRDTKTSEALTGSRPG